MPLRYRINDGEFAWGLFLSRRKALCPFEGFGTKETTTPEGDAMRKSMVVCAILGAASAAFAQESAVPPNAARDAALNRLSSIATTFSVAPSPGSLKNADSPALPATLPSPAEPAPPPKFVYGSRDDYRFQLAASYAFVRFSSSAFSANMSGLNTAFTYYTNEWFGVEGSVTAAFAGTPSGFSKGLAKYLFYGGGPHVAYRNGRWEPWLHALAGGVHVQPQTAAGGRNGFGLELGGGVDWRKDPHLGVRVEADWARSQLYSQGQNNVQISAGVVFHF